MKSNNSKILTIAIPTYNLGSYLKRNVESISRSSRLHSVDVLIVDDGSTDDTSDIADELARVYPEFTRCVHKPNGHYGSAVNTAIREAQGTFFKIIDADDEVNPSGLDALVDALVANGSIDMLVSDYAETNGGAITRNIGYKLPKSQIVKLDGSLHGPFPMHSLTYRTSLLRDNGIELDEGIAYTDVEFVVYPIPFVKTLFYLPEVVYLYALGRDGQSVEFSQMIRNLGQHTRVLCSLLEWYSSCDFPADNGSQKYSCKRIAAMYNDQVRYSMLAPSHRSLKSEVLRMNERVREIPEIYGCCLFGRSAKILELTRFNAYGLLGGLHRLKRKVTRH